MRLNSALVSAALLYPLCVTSAFGQSQPVPVESPQITAALLGNWTGVLEYRDYSEPSTSTKRVDLPTWLTVSRAAEGLRLTYIYDDGPGKILKESSVLVIDAPAARYRIVGTDAVTEDYRIAGLEQLKDGRGRLVLTGPGKDNDKPAEIRITLNIRRNLLEWLEEVRPAGSHDAFAFRHLYRFTRAEPPAPTASH